MPSQVLPMDSLRFVERNDQKYYCFIDVCINIFPNTPKSTVRHWLKALNIPTVICSGEERKYFRSGNPTLCGSFGIISDKDLQRVMDYRVNSQASPKKRAIFGFSSSNQPTTLQSSSCSSQNSCSTTLNHSESFVGSPSTSIVSSTCYRQNSCPTNLNHSESPVGNESIVNYSDSSGEDGENNKDIPHAVNPKGSCNTQESQGEQAAGEMPAISPVQKKRRSASVLPLEEAPQQLRTAVRSLREYYERMFNPLRCGPPFSKATADKTVERLMGFMHYCLHVENISNLSLLLFNDADLFTKYIGYMKDVRQLKPSTISNFLTVAINVVKYNLRTETGPSVDVEKSPQIHAYRSYQRQFQRESYLLTKRAKEGLTSKSSQQFYFAHVLETLRNLRNKYLESSGLQKARHLHNFVLLALYMRAMPGRSKELRTLRLYLESEKQQPFEFDHFESANFIVFELGQNIYIVQSDFKTAKSTGATKLDISDDVELVYYLRLFVNARPSLMLGKSHDYFFLNGYGEAFQSSSSIAKYMGDIFEHEVSIRASTTALRHALVTYFSTLDESNDVNLQKSLAVLMKHSVRYQQSVYTDLSHAEKTKASRNLLRNKITASVFGEPDDIVPLHDIAQNAGEDSSDEVELRPETGDIVALLDGVSTKENVNFFLAKIARFTEDRSEVHLIHLELVESSDNLYRLKPGKVWTELVGACVFPLDIVWDSSEKAYELRTSPEEIFKFVHGY